VPELPEVETTANDLNELIVGKKISDVWSGYDSPYYYDKPQIKDPKFFKKFKKIIIGTKVISVSRRAKNVLINLSNNKTILIHMKMTGHILYGKYEYSKKNKEWTPKEKSGPLNDPFNAWLRFVIEFSNGKHLALSDMRKFAKVTLLDTASLNESEDLKKVGPEIFEKNFNFKVFKERLEKKPNGNIKTVLMDQEIVAGIGNIYSDEALWLTKIHPETKVKNLINKNKKSETELKELFKNIKLVLKKGINFKGDSMQDYRRPSGESGSFQKHHAVYQRKKEDCKRNMKTKDKARCKGKIERIVVNGRSSHFCPVCQKI